MFSRVPIRLAQRVAASQSRKFAFHQAMRRTVGVVGGVATGAVIGGVTFVSCWGAAYETAVPPFDIRSLRQDIEAMIQSNPSMGPTLVRLAWHEAGSYDCKKKDGAPNSASMRFKPECEYGGNKGLDKARDALEPLKHCYPQISYADLWVLAACTAIEYMGGPEIEFHWGRVDAKDGSVCGPDGRLPDGAQTQNHVRTVFTRLGFNDQETVALLGAHTCGECRLENSGFVGPWTHDKNGFDNSFFTALLEEEWEVNPEVQKLQFMDRETKNLMMLPSDIALILDPKYRKFVELYAKDNDAFLKDFASAFQRLTEQGVSSALKTIPQETV